MLVLGSGNGMGIVSPLLGSGRKSPCEDVLLCIESYSAECTSLHSALKVCTVPRSFMGSFNGEVTVSGSMS